MPVTVARFGRSVGVVCCACVATARRILMNTAHRRRVDVDAIMTSLSYALRRFSMRNRLSSSERLE